MTKRFFVHEIEHDGDVDHVVSELHRLGATNIDVRGIDFDEESMGVSIEVTPEDWEKIKKEADICL